MGYFQAEHELFIDKFKVYNKESFDDMSLKKIQELPQAELMEQNMAFNTCLQHELDEWLLRQEIMW